MGVISHPNQPILGHCNIAEKENRDANYFERSWWHQSSTLGSDYPLLDTNIGKRTTGPQWDGVALVKTVLCQKGGTLPLTLVGTRHFAIFHGTRGRGLMPPPSRFAPNWARGLIKRKQRVSCHETKPLTPEFKNLGQLLTLEFRSMTQKWRKGVFADNFVSEQARAAI